MKLSRFMESVPADAEGSLMAAVLRNKFLSAIAPEDLAAMLPRMREVELRKGQVLIEQESAVEEVHFPLSAQLCNLTIFTDGRSVETAVVGSEGMSGLAPFLADAPCAWQVVVQIPGSALALPAAVLRSQARESADLRALLVRLVHDYQAQSAQTAACNTVHRSTAKLARWLLMFDDRSQGTRLEITQQDLAALMGMQRTTINQAAGELKAAGAIDYLRGAIRITDRTLLERTSCECYEMQRNRSRALGLDPA
ncbi:Crp/Fnr family transcriptional regulator [Brevundimonas sp. BR2-1]|uniref:Crp/Fnr family transcriptional regulator n=1 Tax=Brevundimonas sp. BR2-1 TaxID=3031123 RepID=UPI003094E9DE